MSFWTEPLEKVVFTRVFIEFLIVGFQRLTLLFVVMVAQ